MMTRRDFFNQSLLVAGGTVLLSSGNRATWAAITDGDQSQPPRSLAEKDWAQFIVRQDIVWERLPTYWWEASFNGNGLMGAQIWQDSPQSLRIEMGRSDVEEHREIGAGNPLGSWARSRLPIGYFSLQTVGKITGGTMRLDLWNAEVRGEIVTESGKIQFRGLIHADEMIWRMDIERSGEENGASLNWHALEAVSPRKNPPADYAKNPPFVLGKSGAVQTCFQSQIAGGETTTAWRQIDAANQSTLIVSVVHTYPATNSTEEAVNTVNRAMAQDEVDWVSSHRAWWHRFYQASFLSLSDPAWESFYWIQLFKLASATRADRALIDNHGPWLQPTFWPAAWWNLNVQLSYWPTLQANHLELAESLSSRLEKYADNLVLNVAPEYRHDSAAIGRATGQDLRGNVKIPVAGGSAETGNLLWTLNNYWQHLRMAMDKKRMQENFFPLLRRAVSYHLHFLQPDAKGVLHLPDTHSPEYGNGPDAVYDLALLRWGLHTLVKCCKRFNIVDPDLAKWKETLENLVPYPTDENGYMIAATLPFNKGHRHFSHLLQVFPLHLVHRDQRGAWEMVDKSVRHWMSMDAKRGYSFTGAALMMTSFGQGNRALEYLVGSLPFIEATTMHRDPGPVIETPLSAAHVMQQMLLQSWAGPEEEIGVIRVFPAMPDAWPDTTFENMRAEGAFLVSAVRENGKTRFVRIESLAGELCRIQPALEGKIHISGVRKGALHLESDGVYRLDLKKGETAVLYSGAKLPDITFSPINSTHLKSNLWGLKSDTSLQLGRS